MCPLSKCSSASCPWSPHSPWRSFNVIWEKSPSVVIGPFLWLRSPGPHLPLRKCSGDLSTRAVTRSRFSHDLFQTECHGRAFSPQAAVATPLTPTCQLDRVAEACNALKIVSQTATRSFDAPPATRCPRSPLRWAATADATMCISCDIEWAPKFEPIVAAEVDDRGS